ncbi:Sensor histidine kinase YehU [compost metagenome]
MLFLFSSIKVSGQELIFQNISNRLSLPSAECYNVMQDRKGYLWIATEQGLIRYDGSTSKIFSEKENLPEKAAYSVIEDKDGQLWISTSKNRTLYYKDGIFKTIPLKPSVYPLDIDYKNLVYQLSSVDDELYIHSTRQLQAVNIRTKVGRSIAPLDENKDIVFIKSGKALLPINSNYLIYRLKTPLNSKPKIKVMIKDGTKTLNFNISPKNPSDLHWRVLSCYANGFNFFSQNNRLVKITPQLGYEIHEMPGSIISLYSDKDGGLWVGTIKNGVFYYPNPSNLSAPIVSLNNLSVSGVCQDKEGNIWCTTLEDGVHFSNAKQVVQYNNKNAFLAPPTLLKKVGRKLFVATAQSGLMTYGTNGVFSNVSKQLTNDVKHIFFSEGKYVIGQNSVSLTSNINFENIKPTKWSYNDAYLNDAIYESTSDTTRPIYSITYNKILKHDKNLASFFTLIKSAGKCIQYLDSNTLIYGCANGLYMVGIKTQTHQRIPGIERTVTKILVTSKDELWVATKGDGLHRWRKGLLERMDKRLKLPTNVFYDLALDSLGKIWVATNMGIISLQQNNGKYQVQRFETSNGLPANEIYKLAVYQNELFFSSPKGLARFPINTSLTNKTPPTFSLIKLTVNQNQFSTAQPSIRLKHTNNSLSLAFSILSFKNGSQQLIYRLKPDQPFTKVQGNQIILQNLKPDDYALTVYALNNDGLKSISPYLLKINISPPFWQTWWFLVLCIILIAVLFLWLRQRQIIHIKKKEEEKTRIVSLIAQSKLSALQARMNPHFIFNAINSIQNYILKNQAEAAQGYLTKFSRLIRLVLSQSAVKTITLKEEIDTLNLYIELEKLRFKEAFDYEVNLARSINTQTIYLPTMLIQPYVENAIWHGLMNLKGIRKGKLLIDIVTTDAELHITVEDNGIGREKAAQFKKQKNYVSAGMMLTEERLHILQDIFPNGNFKVKVTDLAIGTKVEIVLSLTYDDNTKKNAD